MFNGAGCVLDTVLGTEIKKEMAEPVFVLMKLIVWAKYKEEISTAQSLNCEHDACVQEK
jgi:hypothetical protein